MPSKNKVAIMPKGMETEEGQERIGRAIDRRQNIDFQCYMALDKVTSLPTRKVSIEDEEQIEVVMPVALYRRMMHFVQRRQLWNNELVAATTGMPNHLGEINEDDDNFFEDEHGGK